MAFQPVPRTASMCLNFTLFGVPMQVCLYFEKLFSSWDGQDVIDMAELAMTNYIADVAPDVQASLILQNIHVKALENEMDFQHVDSNGGTPVPGGVAGIVENAADAFVLSFRTGLTGRSSRGRIYWPAVGTLATDQGVITAATVGVFVTLLTDYIESLESVDFRHVIVSRFTDGAARPAGLPLIVSEYSMSQLIGTQRNRRVGLD